ncbi:ATP-binding protein [Georgenia sp. AZ-5]|uniref:ATP-binding protein n=1 Tax=Georgenia sp. AZ-5 TaxID=3367526 RepID=UPI00375522D5
MLGLPGTGKTHLATALGITAAEHGTRVLFDTATGWVTRPGPADGDWHAVAHDHERCPTRARHGAERAAAGGGGLAVRVPPVRSAARRVGPRAARCQPVRGVGCLT